MPNGRLLPLLGGLVAVCISGGFVASASAAIIAYDPFSYAVGNLEGKGEADAQWAGAWTNASSNGTKNVVSGSLDDAYMTEVGNKAQIIGTNGNSTIWRKMKTSFGSGSVYISFLGQIDTTSQRKWGVTLANSSGSSWAEYPIRIGFPQQGSNTGLYFGVGDDNNYGFTNVSATSVALVVAKVTISGKSATTSMWAYPYNVELPATEPGTVMASATNTSSTNITFNAIELFAGGPSPPLTGQSAYFDELRIGTTWADVVVVTYTPANADVTPQSRSGDSGAPIARRPGETISVANTAIVTADKFVLSGVSTTTNVYPDRFSVSNLTNSTEVAGNSSATGTVAFNQSGLLNGVAATGQFQFTVAGKNTTATGETGTHTYALSATVSGNTGGGQAIVAAGGGYAGLSATDAANGGTLAGFATKVGFAGGTNTSSQSATLAVAFPSAHAGAAAAASDVVSVSGIGGTPFVLEMTYDESLFNESHAGIGWWDSGHWANAVDHNSGNNAAAAQQGFAGSFEDFKKSNGGNVAAYLGAWGRDVANDTVWAVLNHNSDFAAFAMPEPATLLLLGLAAPAALLRRKRRP